MSKEIKRALTIIAIFAIYFIIVNLPTPAGLTHEGQIAIALMVCVVVTWVTEVIPIIVSSMVFMFMFFFVGLNTETQVVKDFASPTLFFVFASVLLAYALDNCGLNNRLALKLTVLSRGKPKRLILYLMIGTAFLSTIISNVPACAAFFFIVLALCKKNNCIKGSSNFAKAGILGVIFAAMIGGNATPAGSSLNVLGLSLLQSTVGQTLNFMEWAIIGIPIVVVMVPLLWLIVCFVYPPEFDQLTGLEDTKKEMAELGPLKASEWKFIVITVFMLFIWFTEGTLHNVPLSTSTMFIAALYFFPGISLLTYEYVADKLDWTLIIMIGASGTFGAAMYKTGGSSWLANAVLGPFTESNLLVLIFVIVLFTTLIHLLVPSNPAIVSIMVPTLAAFSADTGIEIMALYLPMAFSVAANWMLPFDPVPLICWPEKYFSMWDYFKAGIIGHIVLVFVVVAAMMLIAKPLGYF